MKIIQKNVMNYFGKKRVLEGWRIVITIAFFTSMVTLVIFPSVGFGEIIQLPPPLPQFTGAQDIPKIIGMVLRMLFGIIGTIALIMFIYGGFLWMTAFGEEQKIKRGWDTMIWGAIGLVIIFGSYVAVDFVLKAIIGS